MNDLDVEKLIEGMTLEEIKSLRETASKKIKNIRKTKSQRYQVYVQAEYRDSFELAVRWAHERNLIKRPTKWSFAKFALLNTIKMIIDEIEREKLNQTYVNEEVNMFIPYADDADNQPKNEIIDVYPAEAQTGDQEEDKTNLL